MHITRLEITNFEGLKALELEPGDITILKGRNGAGKTTVLEAVRAAITNRPERSHLVYNEEGEGLILFELSDGMKGSRRITGEGTTAGSVRLRIDGATVGSPQSHLNQLSTGFGFNPVAFLALSENEQREAILRVTDIELPFEEAIRLGGREWHSVDYSAHPLIVLKEIEDLLYFHRRDVNRDAKSLLAAAEEMRQSVTEDVDEALLERFDLDRAIATLTRAQDANEAIAKAEHRAGEIQASIAALQEEAERVEERLAELREQQVDPEPIRADIQLFKAQRDAWRALQDAKDREAEADALSLASKHLSNLIEEVRQKPAQLLQGADLPVEGLSTNEAGDILVHGLPISELSTGESLMLACEIAIASLPPDGLRIVLVDGLEQLDKANRTKMFDRLAAAGVQVLACEVTDSDLTVITDFAKEQPPVVDQPGSMDVDDIPF
jgi:DNA repair exonuclease SbcCD ATPase subunit